VTPPSNHATMDPRDIEGHILGDDDSSRSSSPSRSHHDSQSESNDDDDDDELIEEVSRGAYGGGWEVRLGG
jgi:hypothetical protein